MAGLTMREIGILILFFTLILIILINRIWRRHHKDEVTLEEIVNAANGRDYNSEINGENSDDSQNSEIPESEKITGVDETPVNEKDINYEKAFFERTQNGEKSVLLTTVPSIQKCKILQSLLYASGIPSYAQTENVSGIFGNTSGLPDTIFSVKLNICESDLESSQEILNDFNKN